MQTTFTIPTPANAATTTNKFALWSGRVLTALSALFLAFDGIIKVLNIQPVVDASVLLGLPVYLAPTFGALLLACLVVYLVPRTAVLGAILLTGYLGGAIAIQARVEAVPFSLVFPVILGAMVWGGLILRDKQVRALLLRG